MFERTRTLMIDERGNRALHFLDRYAGIPAVALLSLLRSKRTRPREIKAIGLLKTVAMGDTVLLSAIVADLRAAFPDARIVFFSGKSNYEMACMLEGIDTVVPMPVNNPIAAVKAIRSVKLDALLDFGQWPRWDALLTLLSGARFTVGFATAGQYRHFGYDVGVPHSFEVHALENNRSIARALGVATKHLPALSAPLPPLSLRQPYAVFHLWPGGMRRKAKQWPLPNWRRLGDDFLNWGMDVVLTGSAADRPANNAYLSQFTGPPADHLRNAAGQSLMETVALLAGARAVVCVDTGIMHMASALGAPLVALHGPTSARRWGPLSRNSIAVESPLPGCGYIHLGWERPPRPLACMESIRYEAVRDACLSLLRRERIEQSEAGQPELRPGAIPNAAAAR